MSSEFEFDKALEEQEADLDQSKKVSRRWKIAIIALAILSLLFGMVCLWLAMDNQRLADANARYGAEQAQEKKAIATEAQKALCGTKENEIYDKAICEKLAVAAEEPAPPTLAPPVPGGPSQEELVKAFREYCADGNCRGQDGASPTADDIAAAFVKFCADGRCTGSAGKDAPPAENGKDGANGQNGADGKDGASLPPSGEMVLAAVTTYCSTSGQCVGPAGKDGGPPSAEVVLAAVQQVCANNACVGPMGPAGTAGQQGEKGDPGEPGRGIQSQFCGDDRRYLITYTDGSTADGGICREALIPGVGP